MRDSPLGRKIARLPRAQSRQSLATDAELAGYIQAFEKSTDRSRRLIFIVTTVCVLLLIAQWNIQHMSWAVARVDRAMERKLQAQTNAALPSPRNREERIAELHRQVVFDSYPQQFVQRMLMVQLPAVGIATDVNEFGLLGGISLLLLMLLLCLALARQHENLQLAVFKIRKIYNREQRPDDGESVANYLYHALAMTQMLGVPPTLARWGRNDRLAARLIKLFLFIPAVLQTWIAWSNASTRKVAEFYFGEVQEGRLALQKELAALLWLLSVMCYFYVRAMGKRWFGIFFRINPRHSGMQPDTFFVWLKMHARWTEGERTLRKDLCKRLRTGKGTGGTRSKDEQEIPTHTEAFPFGRVTWWNVRKIAHRLQKHARNSALRDCEQRGIGVPELVFFDVESRLPKTGERRQLIVEIKWTFRVEDAPAVAA